MSDYPHILPAQWDKHWSAEARSFLVKLIDDITYAFDARGYDAHFMLYPPQGKDQSFVSLGISKQGKQKNGSNHSVFCMFGFNYEDAWSWPDDYIQRMADKAIAIYRDFLFGEFPTTSDFHETFAAEWPFAPAARLRKVEPPKSKPRPVVQTDMWGEPVEIDPLS